MCTGGTYDSSCTIASREGRPRGGPVVGSRWKGDGVSDGGLLIERRGEGIRSSNLKKRA